MPRRLGYPVRRIALVTVLTILGGALVAHAIHRPRENSVSAAAPSTAVPSVPIPSMPVEPATPATVAPAPAPAPLIASADTPMPRGSAGMVVGIDPETGALGLPSKADRAALERTANLSPALDRSEAGLTVVHKPDGSRMVDLQGRFQSYMVVRLTPEGRKFESCVQEPEVEKALEDAAAPSAGAGAAPPPEAPHEER